MKELGNEEIIKKYVDAISNGKLPIGETECSKLGFNIKDLEWIVLNVEKFYKLFSKSCLTDSQILVKLYQLIVGFGLTNFVEGEEREYSSSDFPYTAKNAVKCFEYCGHLLDVCKNLESSDKVHIIIKSLFLCATHSDIYIWSSDESKNSSLDFMKSLLSFTNHVDLPSLLCDDNFYPTIFKKVLKEMRTYFEKDKWQKNPSSCYVFSWFLLQVKHPHLADYLFEVFSPPHMFMLDSHEKSHHLIAIECFSHILDNVPSTLIKVGNRSDVIYSLLKGYMHSSEEEIIAVLAPCFLKLPDFKYQKLTQISWSRYDECLNMLLIRAEMEHKMQIKLLYLSHIHSFIQVLPPFKHLKRLWKVLEDCLSKDSDVLCLLTALKILKDVIKSCWPRMTSYCFRILKYLAIFLVNIQKQKIEDRCETEEMHHLCKEILFLSKCACKEEFENIVMKYVEDIKDVDEPGLKLFKSVLENPEL